ISQGSKFRNTSVSENDVEPPLHPDGLIETIKVGQIGNVSLNASHVAADCLHGFVKLLPAAACDEDIGALFDKELCRSQPDPSRAAGDDCYFPLQLVHGRYSR